MRLSSRHIILLFIISLLVVTNFVLFKSLENIRSKETSQNNVGEKFEAAVAKSLEAPALITGVASSSVSILHFGDAMFDRNVRKRMNSGTDLFSSLRDSNIMKGYDIRMLNLEGPIIEMNRDNCQQKAYNFQFASDTANMLKSEGFNAVTISNNHIFDCYKAGAISTLKYLNKAGIAVAGAPLNNDNYTIIRTDTGSKVALIGIDTTISSPPTKSFYSLVSKLKDENDFIVVSMHSGVEYEDRATSEQINLAHKIIDAGADAVIGNHPHVIENMESYNGGVIFYSLGNFIFDQIGEKENEGLGVGLTISKKNIGILLLPYNIIKSVPTFMNLDESEKWCENYLKNNSPTISSSCSTSISRLQKN